MLAGCAKFRGALLGAAVCACSPAVGQPQPVDVRLEIPRLDGGAPPPAENGVRFGRTPFRVGSRWSTSIRAESVSEDKSGGEQVSAYISDYTVEVLALNGPAPARVRVFFERNVHEYQGSATPSGIHQKTYIVEAKGPAVTSEAGVPAPSDEATRVLDVFPDLGTRMRVDEVLPDDPMQIGERRDDLATAILRMVHPRAWKQDAGTASLVRVEGETAVFAVTLDATSASGMQLKVKGEANVRLRDSSLVKLVLRGSYVPAGANPDDAHNTFSVHRTVKDIP